MDYWYVNQADEAAKDYPQIAMVDEQTLEKYARSVGRKGVGDEVGEWLVDDIAQELKTWGHGPGSHFILKCDGEPAMRALRDAVIERIGGRIIPEQSAKGESSSNGAVENSIRQIRDQVKVLKQHVEAEIGQTLESDSPILQWLIRWAPMLLSRYMVGKDGRTGFERRRGGRVCKIPVAGFGETVRYKELKDTKSRKAKLETDIREGVWLGHSRYANQFNGRPN